MKTTQLTNQSVLMKNDMAYQAIKSSIEVFGVCQNIILDEQGQIISGNLRRKACEELGKDCPTTIISGLSQAQKEDLKLELNLCRKHYSLKDKRVAARKLLRSDPAKSDRSVAINCGLNHSTVAKIRQKLISTGEIHHVDQRQGSDGKTYKFPKISVENHKQEERAKHALQQLGDAAPKKPMILKQAERRVREKALKSFKPPAQTIISADEIQILHCDFRKLEIRDDSVPLIIADPPYDRSAISLYEDLAEFASHKLTQEGFLIAYTGLYYFPEVIAALTKKLTWVWKMVITYPKSSRYIHGRNISNMHRDVVVFSRGNKKFPEAMRDLIVGGGLEKDAHEWQQNLEEEIHLIEKLSSPGDLVLSPFGGGFTSALACHRLNRKCITCDIDANSVEIGLGRLAEERSSASQNQS